MRHDTRGENMSRKRPPLWKECARHASRPAFPICARSLLSMQVDWYPWGDEAFAKARTENKPIFLSIGYSTCHWCHVMEHESFENEKVAEILNAGFVPIKVDREERPDVDKVYVSGWPFAS